MEEIVQPLSTIICSLSSLSLPLALKQFIITSITAFFLCCVLEQHSKSKQTEFEILQTESEILQTDFEILQTESKILQTDFEILHTDFEILQTESEILQTEFEILPQLFFI